MRMSESGFSFRVKHCNGGQAPQGQTSQQPWTRARLLKDLQQNYKYLYYAFISYCEHNTQPRAIQDLSGLHLFLLSSILEPQCMKIRLKLCNSILLFTSMPNMYRLLIFSLVSDGALHVSTYCLFLSVRKCVRIPLYFSCL